MSLLILPIFLIVAGLILVVWGADRFVMGAACTAHHMGVSSLLIGLTIVGFGTSAPEILVSINAAAAGNPGLALGNALGSNIANIGLILGATAILIPLIIRSDTLRRELPILLMVTLVGIVPFADGYLGRVDGAIMLGALIVLGTIMVRLELRAKRSDPLIKEAPGEVRRDLSALAAGLWLVIGLGVLLIGARVLVVGAVDIAHQLQISDLVIGLTVIAIGTSVPELAATIVAAKKGQPDLAIGNVIGSNMYNLLAVAGLAGVIHPAAPDAAILSRDYPLMIGITVLLFLIASNVFSRMRTATSGGISRRAGILLLLIYVFYQGYLVFTALG